MKERTHERRGGRVTTAEPPRSADEIDLDRIVWDPEYRRSIKPLLTPAARPERGPRATKHRRRD